MSDRVQYVPRSEFLLVMQEILIEVLRKADSGAIDPSWLVWPENELSKRRIHCPICLEHFKPLQWLVCIEGCRHTYHYQCFDEWYSSDHKTCPICRGAIGSVGLAWWNPGLGKVIFTGLWAVLHSFYVVVFPPDWNETAPET